MRRPLSIVLVSVSLACSGSAPSGSVGGPKGFTLTLTSTGDGTLLAAGTQCRASICMVTVAAETVVAVSAVSDSGASFSGFGGDCAGATCMMTMSADHQVSGSFSRLPPPPAGKALLTVNLDGSGSVKSTPAGIDCPGSCTASFPQGKPVSLAATPGADAAFISWSGACTGTGGCELTLTADAQVTATFQSSSPSRWVSTVSGAGADAVLSVATDSMGNTVALIVDTSSADPVGLRKLDSTGRGLWEKYFGGSYGPVRGGNLAIDGSGNIYLLWPSDCADFGCRGTIDFGNGATNSGALVKFDSNGKLLWEDRLSEGAAGLAVNSNGEAAVFNWGSTDRSLKSVVRVNPDGTIGWRAGSRGLVQVGIDPGGNVLVSAVFSPTDPIFGRTFPSNGPVLAKLKSSDGSLLWAARIAEGTQGAITTIGTSAAGTIVIAGSTLGSFDFGGQHFDTGTATCFTSCPAMMFVYESDGRQRFARRLPDAKNFQELLAVDAAGKASLVGNRDSSAIVVSYNLAGDLLGTQNVPLSGSGSAQVSSIAIAANHSTVVGGVFAGTVDFGTGSLTSQQQDGLVVNLGR